MRETGSRSVNKSYRIAAMRCPSTQLIRGLIRELCRARNLERVAGNGYWRVHSRAGRQTIQRVERYFKRETWLPPYAIKDSEFCNISSRVATTSREELFTLRHKVTRGWCSLFHPFFIPLDSPSLSHSPPLFFHLYLRTCLHVLHANREAVYASITPLQKSKADSRHSPYAASIALARGPTRTLYGFVTDPPIYPSVYSRLWLTHARRYFPRVRSNREKTINATLRHGICISMLVYAFQGLRSLVTSKARESVSSW